MDSRSQLSIFNIPIEVGLVTLRKKLLVFAQNWIMAKAACSTHVGMRGTTVMLNSYFHFTSNPNLTIMLSPQQKVWLL